MNQVARIAFIATFSVTGCAAIAGVRDDLELVTSFGADAAAGGPIDATTDGTTCRESETVCGGTCVNLQTDPGHCGACNVTCKTGSVCNAGSCQTSGCSSGLTDCKGACVNLANDPNHCGGCTVACGQAQDCVASSCVSSPVKDAGRPEIGPPG